MKIISLIFVMLTMLWPNMTIAAVGNPNSLAYIYIPDDAYGSNGAGNGQFQEAVAISYNSTHIFVGDWGNQRIQIFDLDGNYMEQFPVTSSGSNMDEIRDILINDTHILVVINYSQTIPSVENPRVDIYDLAGNYVDKFGEYGSGVGQFWSPWEIVSNSTHYFVTGNNQILIFDMSGVHKGQFGSAGSGDGQFTDPRALAQNETHIFIGDYVNKRIVIFDINGNYVSTFGSFGTGNGQFQDLSGIAVNENCIMVSDATRDDIQLFDHNLNFITTLGSSGSAWGQMNLPRDISLHGTKLYVAEGLNHRVQIFHNENFAPQNLISQVSLTEDPSIFLMWDAQTDYINATVVSYNIYRSFNSNFDSSDLYISTNNTYFIDEGVDPDLVYNYAITTLTNMGESKFSDLLSAQYGVPYVETVTVTDDCTSCNPTTITEEITVTTTEYTDEILTTTTTTTTNISDAAGLDAPIRISIITFSIWILINRKKRV